ncbi:MAG: NOB1 family endonuclease [Candidatus Heimdallarchaeota archaeon]
MIFDSGIIMNIDHLPDIKGEFYTTQLAIDELQSPQAKHLFELFREKYRVSILIPDARYLKEVKKCSKSIGQIKLSETDVGILALALMLKEEGDVLLLSDDYGLRNVGHELELKSKGIKTKGGNQLRKYNYECSACKSIFSERIEECDICGNNKFTPRRRKK